ncbi:alpha/beta fold hydrolase [Microbacterium sp.]|uniref:alpha/beta fold hydrolase n=1 Tax=Microbacterium sp. TaxID=51671 RepID=UPI003A854715
MTHIYRTVDVPVAGGDLRVGVWDVPGDGAPAVVLIHGVTSSHLVWQWVARALPGVRLIAPDLRGRGRSSEVAGPAGMTAHAEDLSAVFAHFGLERTVVIGHSMGAFVAVVFAHRHPGLVSRLLLIDGGLPLAAPPGLSPDDLVAAILGPTAARLDLRFADTADYLAFWREHPAFGDEMTPELERYFGYDLVRDGDLMRPATSYTTTVEDTVDLNTGTALIDALAALRHPVRFVTVPRGLRNEEPGLYPPAVLDALLAPHPGVQHERWDGFNHYTVVMSEDGAAAVARVIRTALAR